MPRSIFKRDGETLQLPPPHHEKRLEGRYIQNLRRLPPPQQQLQSTPQGGCMRLTIVANDFLWLLLLLAAAPAYRATPNSGHRWGPGTSGSSGTSGPAWYMRGGGTLAVGLAWGGGTIFLLLLPSHR